MSNVTTLQTKREEAKKRFTSILVAHGITADTLADLTVTELRDMVEEHEYIEVRTATACGGVSTKRLPLSKAA